MKRRDLAAGVLDAGFSSAATLAIGVYAIVALDPVVLGIYALCFRAFSVGALFPAQLVFAPIEIHAATLSGPARFGTTRGARPSAFAALLVAAAVTLLWLPIAPAAGAEEAIVAIAITGMACSVASPLQDHVRRRLHIGRASWAAAAVSTTQLAGVLVVGGLLHASGVSAAWIPFGALALANCVSGTVGALLLHRLRGPNPPEPLPASRERLRSGMWLLLVGALGPATAFGSAALVSLLGGIEAVGFAEAARMIAQPVLVLATGLGAVLGPRAIDAGARRDLVRARALRREFMAAILVAGVVYTGFLGWDWAGNPLADWLSTAYAIEALVLVSCASHVVNGLVYPYRSELLGGRRERRIASVDAIGNLGRMGIAGLSGLIGAMALPAGFLLLGLVRVVGYRSAARRLYKGGGAPGPAGAQAGSEVTAGA